MATQRLSFLSRNKEMLPPADAITCRYKHDLVAAKTKRDQARAGARARDDDDDAVIDTHVCLSFEEMLGGLDSSLDEWLGFGTGGMTAVDAASGASAAAAIGVADDDALLADVARGTCENLLLGSSMEEQGELLQVAAPEPIVVPPIVVPHGLGRSDVQVADVAGGTRAAAAAAAADRAT